MSDLENKIKKTIDLWGYKVVNHAGKVLTEITNYPAGQSPDIVGSIDFKVAVKPDGTATFSLVMANYWEYIEFGVNGWQTSHGSKFTFKKDTPPIPAKAIESFLEKRHISFKDIKKHGRASLSEISLKRRKAVKKKLKGLSYEQERKALSFLLGRSIKRKGIEPNPFRDKIITQELKDELRTNLAKIFKEEFIIQINKD